MREKGEVVDVTGTIAKVRFIRTSACGKCNACGFKNNQNEVVIETENKLHARVHDRVEIQIASGSIIKASAYAYVFPLVMLIIGLVAGYMLGNALNIFGNPEIFSAICGIVLTAAAFLVIKLTEPAIKRKMHNRFIMVSKED
jgi:sigma-E factor negative regulatory protein RseC